MSIFAGLYQEWTGLATTPTTTATLRRWGSEDPNLTGLTTMAELAEAAHSRDHGRSNDILFALARRAGTDDLAARTLLQLMLPGLYALTRRCRRLGPFDERASMVLATAFERIRTYPLTRPGRVTTNIMLDTMRRVYDAARVQDRLDDHDGLRDDEAAGPVQSGTSELLELLAWAQERGHLSADAASLIALVRVVEVPVVDLVGRFGNDPQSIRRRRQRAEGRLREAVLAAA
ncbi:MAG: hypothetical protein M3011_03985 [Actinomycetota bacterium]|nr:hypothetical protein [Actinomycetota bacterium]